MLVPLPNTMEGTTLSPKSLAYLHNYYNIDGRLVQREGYERVDKYDEDSRPTGSKTNHYASNGLLVSADGEKVYAIFGLNVYTTTIDSNGYPQLDTNIGSITRINTGGGIDSMPEYAVGYTGIAFCTATKKYFIDTDADTLTELSDADLPNCSSVAYLDGRYIWLTSDGESVFWSEVNDAGNINPLNFFDAESRPDPNRKLVVVGNDLYICGSKSVERFTTTGSSSRPYQRAINSVLPVGYVGGLVSFSTRFIFIGQDVGGSLNVYEVAGSEIRAIAPPLVVEMLNNQHAAGLTFEDIAKFKTTEDGVQADTYDAFGHNVVIFRFNRMCWYALRDGDQYNWGFLGDGREDDTNVSPKQDDYRDWGFRDFDYVEDLGDFNITFATRAYRFINHVWFKGLWLCQRSIDEDDAGIFVKAATASSATEDISEITTPISRGFRAFLRDSEDKDFEFKSLEIAFSKQGVYRTSSNSNPTGGDTDDKIRFYSSKTGVNWGYSDSSETEGRDWSSEFEVPFGQLGDSGRLTVMPSGGILHGDGYTGFIVETNADVPLTIEKVIVND